MTEKFGKSNKGASLLIRKGNLNERCSLRLCLGELRPFQGFDSKLIAFVWRGTFIHARQTFFFPPLLPLFLFACLALTLLST